VATSAVRTKTPVMPVVTLVALSALCRNASRRRRRVTMTGVAGQSDVLAGQRKLGGGVMVEKRRVPRCRVMTFPAFLTQRSSMWVIFAMTVRTTCRGVMECLRLVATGAYQLFVLPQQRKGSESMIESNTFRPCNLTVTTCAVRPKLAAMGIVVRMACTAFAGNGFGSGTGMAGGAGC